MTYTKNYRDFCSDVFKAPVLLKNRETDANAFKMYKEYTTKYSKKIESKKYPVLQKKIWPNYTDPKSFTLDMKQSAVVWMSKAHV